MASSLAALALASLLGCSSSSRRDGPVKVNDLVGSVERVYVDSEVSKEKLQAALAKLQVLTSADFDNAADAYAEFVAAVDESVEQAETLRDTVEPMKEAAEPVFKHWAEDLQQYTSMSLRQRSQARLMETRRLYDAVVMAVDPAQTDYDRLNQLLRDHALFLGNDLNPSALAVIQGDVKDLARSVAQMDEGFDACMVAAQTYVQSTALPDSAERVAASAPAEEQVEEPRPVTKSRRVSGVRSKK